MNPSLNNFFTSLSIDFLDIQLFISLYCNNYQVAAFSVQNYITITLRSWTYYLKKTVVFKLIDNKLYMAGKYLPLS